MLARHTSRQRQRTRVLAHTALNTSKSDISITVPSADHTPKILHKPLFLLVFYQQTNKIGKICLPGTARYKIFISILVIYLDMKRNVVIGTLGVVKDGKGRGSKRWQLWRPTLGLVKQADFPVHRLELFYPPDYQRMAQRTEEDIKLVSPATEVVLIEAPIADPWDLAESYRWLQQFAQYYRFNTDKEDYFLHITTGTHIHQICLFLLAEARLFPARLVQTSPAPEQEDKAQGDIQIIDLELGKYDLLAQRFREEAQTAQDFLKEGINTRNSAFNAMIAEIEQVAQLSNAAILLNGPTGAGKTHLARKIYELRVHNGLTSGSFVAVNCATLVGDGAMSALFGHKRGAFTGAANDRCGFLRQANNGILFLDEIGELGIDEQAMLLHAIETHSFYPLGSDQEVVSHFQLIAGTNRDLQQEVATGRFREDLLARINIWQWTLPGLAERRQDIEANLDFELHKFNQTQHKVIRFNARAKRRYMKFALSEQASWPANFRDLNASVVRMATLNHHGIIDENIVNTEIKRLQQRWHSTPNTSSSQIDLNEILSPEQLQSLDLFEQLQLSNVIEVCQQCSTMAEAGRRLFNVSREQKTSANDSHRIKTYLNKYGLIFKDIVKTASIKPQTEQQLE
jgi:transcriptional regulatory protein RtcR